MKNTLLLFVFLLAMSFSNAQTSLYSLDNTFRILQNTPLPNTNGLFMTGNIEIDANNHITAIGNFCSQPMQPHKCSMLRLDPHGLIDNTFSANYDSYPLLRVFKSHNNKFLIGSVLYLPSLHRRNNDGSIDNTFSGNGFIDDLMTDICVQPSGKILVAGKIQFGLVGFSMLYRLLPDGQFDQTFNANRLRRINDLIFNILPLPSNRYILAGTITNYSGRRANLICKIDGDGNPDTTFYAPQLDTLEGSINHVYPTTSGKYLIAGRFKIQGQNNFTALARLNADGSLDTTFKTMQNINYTIVYAILPVRSPSGGYIIGGRFQSYNGTRRGCIAMIDSNGNLNQQQFAGMGIDSVAQTFSNQNPPGAIGELAYQSNGKIIVAGIFSKYDGMPVNGILRLTSPTIGIGEEKTNNYSINIYPNPANGYATVAYNFTDIVENQNTRLSIKDILGKTLQSQTLENTSGSTLIDTRQLTNGIYFYEINHKPKIVGKIIIQNN